MFELPDLIISGFLFISLFFEIFLLLTFLENKKSFKNGVKSDQTYLPSATIVVPCFNEEKSIFGTVESLLALDYPQDKLKIMIIDDGSTDNSWNVIQKYKDNPLIELFQKKNGGKHTALNYAIGKSKSDILGCLDADSFVGPDTLRKIVAHFEDKKVMAVVPSIKVFQPKNILEKLQKVQYEWGIFMRKTLSFINALYVTPGPFSFFRKEVFEKIGPYRLAHNTEDCEMALRMQRNHLKIANCHDAYIYTVAPKKLKALYRQQLRWVYGTLKNIIDYRDLFLKREYGSLGFLVLPVVFISALSALFVTSLFLIRTSVNIGQFFNNWKNINFDLTWPQFNFSWFFIKTDFHLFIGLIAFIIVLSIIFIGKKLAGEKMRPSSDLLCFFIFYPIIAPFWLFKACYNILTSQKTLWR
jgi:cellulose synthase/poly-beta-1,6-N-acetylglucosamine synthase-like glycosyltransferase